MTKRGNSNRIRIFLFFMISAVGTLSAQTSIHLEHYSDTPTEFVTKEQAQSIYEFFDSNELFLWKTDANNCEDRANATAILLDKWGIPNRKAWIFSGHFLKKDKKGRLMCAHGICWKYHVATVIPFKENDSVRYIVLDPSTTESPKTLEEWAEIVTRVPTSYYFVTSGESYIFTGKRRKISDKTFTTRNSSNYAFTMEGLAGYNGLNRDHRKILKSEEGKKKVQATKKAFEAMFENNPFGE